MRPPTGRRRMINRARWVLGRVVPAGTEHQAVASVKGSPAISLFRIIGVSSSVATLLFRAFREDRGRIVIHQAGRFCRERLAAEHEFPGDTSARRETPVNARARPPRSPPAATITVFEEERKNALGQHEPAHVV